MDFANSNQGTNPAPLRRRGEPEEFVLRDCLFVGALPLSWAWAYRRLLDPGTAQGRLPSRIA